VGAAGQRAALFGALPEPSRTEDEVLAYVETLLSHGRILFDAKKRVVEAIAARVTDPSAATHVIRSRAGQKVLTRIRFL